jgi:peptide/nickel transport system substrate-binding protein
MRRLCYLLLGVGMIGFILNGCAGAPVAPQPAQEAVVPATEQSAEAPAEAEAVEEAPAEATEAAAPASEAETSEEGEPITIVFSNIAETATLDPAIAYSSDGLEFVRNVYEGLLEYVPASTELKPALAESWEVSEDGNVYTFKLRQDVSFHDGAPFDADAAKLGLERIQAINQGPASLMTDIEAIEAVDASTLKITLSNPNVYFLGNLPKLALVSPQAIEEHKTDADPWGAGLLCHRWGGNRPLQI